MRPTILAFFPLVLALGGCAGTTSTGTDDTDTTGADDGSHPLVPEEFELLWNAEGECSNEFGDGDQMYMLFEGRVEADGKLSGTERVWWFYADKPRSEDCVDTFTLDGTAVYGDPQTLGYAGAEEFYDTRRSLTEDNCGERYDRIYRSDDDGLYQRLMIDTLNEFNDTPNEDNKIGVFHEGRNYFGEGYVTRDYAVENGSFITPDGEEHAPPAAYRWIGKRCNVSFGGGGGGGS